MQDSPHLLQHLIAVDTMDQIRQMEIWPYLAEQINK